MAITIRNKTTEELIREIGRRTGEGPSAVVRRLVTAEAAGRKDRAVPAEEVERRLAYFEELRRKYPPPDDGVTWSEIEEETGSIFGDDLR